MSPGKSVAGSKISFEMLRGITISFDKYRRKRSGPLALLTPPPTSVDDGEVATFTWAPWPALSASLPSGVAHSCLGVLKPAKAVGLCAACVVSLCLGWGWMREGRNERELRIACTYLWSFTSREKLLTLSMNVMNMTLTEAIATATYSPKLCSLAFATSHLAAVMSLSMAKLSLCNHLWAWHCVPDLHDSSR